MKRQIQRTLKNKEVEGQRERGLQKEEGRMKEGKIQRKQRNIEREIYWMAEREGERDTMNAEKQRNREVWGGRKRQTERGQ